MTNRYSPIDPTTLGPLTLVQVPDKEALLATRMASVKAFWTFYDPPFGAQYDVENLEFDPIKISQEAGVSQEINALSFVNAMGRSTTLAFGFGDNLDAIATRFPGGVPRLNKGLANQETDARYAYRIWLSSNAYSTAGAALAYVFQALTAVASLRDVTATLQRASLEDTSTVVVTCLADTTQVLTSAALTIPAILSSTQMLAYQAAFSGLPGGSTALLSWIVDTSQIFSLTAALAIAASPADADLLAVRLRFQDPAIGTLSDVVAVQGPDIIETSIEVALQLIPNADALTVPLAVMTALLALEEDSRYLGVDQVRMAIDRACDQYGVNNVAIVSPAADNLASDRQFARWNSIKVSVSGFGQ